MALALQHIVREPVEASPGKPPVLILLHGVGSNEHDLLGLAPELDPRLFIISARAPLTLQPGSYGWYHVQFLPDGFIIDEDDAERSRHIVLRFVDEVTGTYDVDGRRVFLMGFSQGAIMSLAAGLSEPERFRGIVAMNGRLLPQVTKLIAGPERLRDFPVLMVHGVEDRVIQVRYAREAREELSKLPVKLDYREYPSGHWVTPDVLRDVRNWLKQQVDAAIP